MTSHFVHSRARSRDFLFASRRLRKKTSLGCESLAGLSPTVTPSKSTELLILHRLPILIQESRWVLRAVLDWCRGEARSRVCWKAAVTATSALKLPIVTKSETGNETELQRTRHKSHLPKAIATFDATLETRRPPTVENSVEFLERSRRVSGEDGRWCFGKPQDTRRARRNSRSSTSDWNRAAENDPQIDV